MLSNADLSGEDSLRKRSTQSVQWPDNIYAKATVATKIKEEETELISAGHRKIAKEKLRAVIRTTKSSIKLIPMNYRSLR